MVLRPANVPTRKYKGKRHSLLTDFMPHCSKTAVESKEEGVVKNDSYFSTKETSAQRECLGHCTISDGESPHLPDGLPSRPFLKTHRGASALTEGGCRQPGKWHTILPL